MQEFNFEKALKGHPIKTQDGRDVIYLGDSAANLILPNTSHKLIVVSIQKEKLLYYTDGSPYDSIQKINKGNWLALIEPFDSVKQIKAGLAAMLYSSQCEVAATVCKEKESTKPFDLEKALSGAPVITADGFKVLKFIRFPELTTRFKNLVLIEFKGSDTEKVISRWHDDSGYNGYSRKPLSMVVQRKTYYANVYKSSDKTWVGSCYNTEILAKEAIDKGMGYVKTISIEIEE